VGLLHLPNGQVRIQSYPNVLLRVQLHEVLCLPEPITNRHIAVHQVNINTAKLLYSPIGPCKGHRLYPFTPAAVPFSLLLWIFGVHIEIIHSNSEPKLLGQRKADPCANVCDELELILLEDIGLDELLLGV